MTVRKKLKRVLCMLLSILFMMSNISYAETATGNIVASGNQDRIKRQISQWIDKGYITKYKNGEFKPDATATKYEVANVVNRTFGLTAKGKTNFSDIRKKDSYYNDMAIAKNVGYFTADKNGIIKPKSAVTRQELAFVIMKVMKLETPKGLKNISLLKDLKQISGSTKYAIEAVLEKGLMAEKKVGEFSPKSTVTKAEALTILDKCLETVVNQYGKAGIYKAGNVAGSVEISAPDITLQDGVIKGNLIIGKQVGDGNVSLKNITVLGNTIVNGGGINSIVIENCKMNHIIIMKEGNMVRVVAVGNTSANNVEMNSGGKLEEKDMIGTGFGSILLSEEIDTGAPVTLIGDFGTVEIQGNDIGVNLSGGTVDSLAVSASATNTNINLGGNSVVSNMTVSAPTSLEGTGKIAAATIQGDSVSLGVTGETSISTLGISATSKGATVELGTGTSVTNLNVDSAANVSGTGKIGTATVNTDGTKITAPTVEIKNTTPTTSQPTGTPTNPTPGPSVGGGNGGGGGGGSSKTQIAGTITISGENKVGSVLTASAPTTAKATVVYQWKKADTLTGSYTNILNATSNIYATVTADAGKFIKVTVTGTGAFEGELSSTPVGPIITRSMKSFDPVVFTQTGDVANLNVQYSDGAAVIAALPAVVSVTLEDDITLANVPLNWVDTDHYSQGVAADYTFTASWGTMPAGVNNSYNIIPPSVKIKVAPGKIEICSKTSGVGMPTSEVKIKINDSFIDQYILYFDGVPLATAKNGVVIISTEILKDLSRVEILHDRIKKKATEPLGSW